jgi:hypothetical protein
MNQREFIMLTGSAAGAWPWRYRRKTRVPFMA